MLSSTAEPRLLFFQAWDFWWNLQDACRLIYLNLTQQPTSQHSGMTRKKCIQLPIFEPVAHGFVHVWCLSLYFLSASFHHLSDNHTFSKLETKLIACSSNHTIEEQKMVGIVPQSSWGCTIMARCSWNIYANIWGRPLDVWFFHTVFTKMFTS